MPGFATICPIAVQLECIGHLNAVASADTNGMVVFCALVYICMYLQDIVVIALFSPLNGPGPMDRKAKYTKHEPCYAPAFLIAFSQINARGVCNEIIDQLFFQGIV